MRPLYAVLQLSPNASPEEVKQVRFVERSRCQNSWRFPQLRWKSCVESPNKSIVASGIGDIYHPIGSIYHWYTTYSPWKLGGYIYIYITYHLLREPETAIDKLVNLWLWAKIIRGEVSPQNMFFGMFLSAAHPKGMGENQTRGEEPWTLKFETDFPQIAILFQGNTWSQSLFFCFHGEFLFQFHR